MFHSFSEFFHEKCLWNQTQLFFSSYGTIPDVTSRSAIPGFIDTSTEHFLLINHLLLIYKYYLYKATEAF